MTEIEQALPGIKRETARPEPADAGYRAWLQECLRRLEAEQNRSCDTHLFRLPVNGLEGIDLYLKDEAAHPTGSLKHRLARSLFLYGLCNGEIRPDTTVVEASSGSTAVSEAYFARLLGLSFVAVVPHGTSASKIRAIEHHGGKCEFAAPAEIYMKAEDIARELNGYYIDQFTNAERATDWRGNNNIAESLFEQMSREAHPVPHWIVVGAGTGGTSATIGRYIRYRATALNRTRLCVADPENSAFFPCYARDGEDVKPKASRIEGVGRPRVEPSFLPNIIDRMMTVADAASMATVWWLRDILQRSCGPSTGLNVYAMLHLALEMKAKGEKGSLVALMCDEGGRYHDTCFDRAYLDTQNIAIDPHIERLKALFG